MEIKVLRREYSRGQWRSIFFGGNIAVGNGEDQKCYDGSMVVGKEFGGRLTQPTPGAAAMLYHYRQNALTLIAGARRVTCFRQRCAQRAPAWLAEADEEDAVSVEVQRWAS